jgi:hypothetical protein
MDKSITITSQRLCFLDGSRPFTASPQTQNPATWVKSWQSALRMNAVMRALWKRECSWGGIRQISWLFQHRGLPYGKRN